MTAIVTLPESQRYARSVEASKRVRWDVEADVIRGRRFDTAHKFLPDGLALADGPAGPGRAAGPRGDRGHRLRDGVPGRRGRPHRLSLGRWVRNTA